MNTWRVGVPGLLSWSVLNTWYNNNNTIIYIYYTKYNVNNNIINVVIIKYIVLVSALSLVSNGPSYQSFVRELFRCITLCRSASVFSYYHVISCDHFPWFLLRGEQSKLTIHFINLLSRDGFWLDYITDDVLGLPTSHHWKFQSSNSNLPIPSNFQWHITAFKHSLLIIMMI